MPPTNLKPTAEARAPFTLDAAFMSDRGSVRATNEDCACVIMPEDPADLARKGVLMAVADGMGGHEGGELASRLAIEQIGKAYYAADPTPSEALAGAFQLANAEILRHGRHNPHLAGMGTTCTAVAVVNGLAWLAHVGDSRLYLVRGGSAYRMTQDHSATMELVKRGLLTLAEADRHEDRNVILRAVGTRDKLEIATWKDPFPLRPGDLLVLATDGLYESIPDADFGRIASGGTTAAQVCRALLDTALAWDGNDNITVAVLRYSELTQ